MASSRIDNGATMYDGTVWREVPKLTLCPQYSHIHEVPVYAQIDVDPNGRPVLGFAMHGPQEPLDIGVEAGVLPFKGLNGYTGLPRLQFAEARPVPWVHSIIVEWWDARRQTYYHFEGGVRVHQVAKKQVWYVKTGYFDDGRTSPDPVGQFTINGKIIFIQRPILDDRGEPAIASSCTNYQRVGSGQQIAGGPSVFTLEHRGTTHYPKFVDRAGKDQSKLAVRVQEAKFNPTRWPDLCQFCNRQGMVVETEQFHEFMHAMDMSVIDRSLSGSWDYWSMGDELRNAEVPATIQH